MSSFLRTQDKRHSSKIGAEKGHRYEMSKRENRAQSCTLQGRILSRALAPAVLRDKHSGLLLTSERVLYVETSLATKFLREA